MRFRFCGPLSRRNMIGEELLSVRYKSRFYERGSMVAFGDGPYTPLGEMGIRASLKKKEGRRSDPRRRWGRGGS